MRWVLFSYIQKGFFIMTNLQRLKMELGNKEYFSDEDYSVYLDEEGLKASNEYAKEANQYALLSTVIDILEALSNNIDYYRSITTEFTTNSQAYKNLKDRIDELYKKRELLPDYAPTASKVTYLYY